MFRGWINNFPNPHGFMTLFCDVERKWRVKLSRLANRSPKIFNMVKFDALNNLIRLTPEGDFFHGSRLLGLVPFGFTLGGLNPCRALDLPKFHPHASSAYQKGAPAISVLSSCQSSPDRSSAGALFFCWGRNGRANS